MATSGRRALAAVGSVSMAGIVALAGCTPSRSASAHPSTGSGGRNSVGLASTPAATPTASAASSSRPVVSTAPLGPPPCYVGLPASWKAALKAGELWHAVPDLHGTESPLGDGSGVLHEADHDGRADFTIMGRDRRVAVELGSVPATSSSQISFSAATATSVAFVYNPDNGPTAQNTWNLYLWTAASRHLSLVARSPVDAHGRPLQGGWTVPVLTDRYLYWIQASADVKGWGGSSLMQYDLDTGHTRRLYAGLTEAVVAYRNLVLFTAITPDAPLPTDEDTRGAPLQLDAIDANTGQPAPVPSGITAAADVANDIVTDGTMLVWNTIDGGLRAWTPTWGRSITLVPDLGWPLGFKLGLSDAAMPRIYGHFVILRPSETYVLDLHTNSFAQLVATPDGEDASGPWLSVQSWTTANSYDRATNIGTYDQYLLDLATLPDLPACH